MAKSDTSQPDLGPDRVLETYDKANTWLTRLADIWKGDIVARLLLVWVTSGTVLNPLSARWLAERLGRNLPSWYSAGYFTVFGLLFITLLWLAIVIRRKAGQDARPLASRRAIRGLAPFGQEDAEFFKKLQRDRQIREFCEAISAPEFKLGVLAGVSGAGKTSLIHAGLLPRLTEGGIRCFAVRLTQRDPIESIKAALCAQLNVDGRADDPPSLARFLEGCFPRGSRPAVLVIDQFEQFFVHCKPGEERQPFIDALREWFNRREYLPLSILLCVREEFFRSLTSILRELDQPLARGNYFDLEKLAPGEARQVLLALAEAEQIEYDSKCIAHIVEVLKSDKDGLVKPADLQMVAESVWRAKDEARKFTETAIQKLGGIEGLRVDYLDHLLSPLKPESKRQQALHVLLAFTEGSARAGTMTIPQLQEKLKSVLGPKEVEDALGFLALPDNKLISKAEDGEAFELVHEVLIPAIQKLVDQALPQVEQDRRLLDRRTSEWLGNEKNAKFLLPWKEWRTLRRSPGLVARSEHPAAAQELLHRSTRRFTRNGLSVTVVLLVLLFGWVCYTSQFGHYHRLKYEMIREARSGTADPELHAQAAITLFVLGNSGKGRELVRDNDGKRTLVYLTQECVISSVRDPQKDSPDSSRPVARSSPGNRLMPTPAQCSTVLERMFETASRIDDPNTRARTLSAVIETAAAVGKSAKGKTWMELASRAAGRIDDPCMKTIALSSVAETAAQIGEIAKAKEWMELAAQTAGRISNPGGEAKALSFVAQTAARIGGITKDTTWMEFAIQRADQINDPDSKAEALSSMAETAAQTGEIARAKKWMELAAQAAGQIKDRDQKVTALSSVARGAARIGETAKAKEWLGLATEAAGQIDGRGPKGAALSSVVWIVAQVGEITKDKAWMELAAQTAGQIDDPEGKSSALFSVAETAARIGESTRDKTWLEFALQRVGQIDNSGRKAAALASATDTAARVGGDTKDRVWMELAAQTTGQIDDPHSKATALSSVAWTAAQIGEAAEAKRLIELAAQTAGQIDDPYGKATALSSVAQIAARIREAAKAKEWLTLVAQEAGQIKDPSQKTAALASVADAAARVGAITKDKTWMESAAQTAGWIDDRSEKAKALSAVAGTAARVAKIAKDMVWIETAVQIAGQINDRGQKAAVLASVARTAARVGEITKEKAWMDLAIQTACQIAEPGRKLATLSFMADKTVDDRVRRLCLEFLQDLRPSATTSPDEIAAAAFSAAKMGRLDVAHRLIDQTGDSWQRLALTIGVLLLPEEKRSWLAAAMVRNAEDQHVFSAIINEIRDDLPDSSDLE